MGQSKVRSAQGVAQRKSLPDWEALLGAKHDCSSYYILRPVGFSIFPCGIESLILSCSSQMRASFQISLPISSVAEGGYVFIITPYVWVRLYYILARLQKLYSQTFL